MSKFSVSKHIASRDARHQAADIYNTTLLGLATIEINITELCNRTCSFCPRYSTDVYPNQKLFMSLDTVRNLTQQLRLARWVGDIHITGFGEPHTHPYLKDIVTELRTYDGLYIEITSNGDRLIDSHLDYTQQLYDAGLDLLTIDCYDGDGQYNERHIKMQTLSGAWRLRSHYDDGNTESLISEYGFNNRAGTMGGDGFQNQCYLPFYKTFIDWDGNMTLCCNDWHRETGIFGNINDIGISACWNSKKMKLIRQGLATGIRKGVCAKCSIVGTKFGKDSFDLLTEN
jgi:MoaA/NifB/PqqE/SkfB family radical SAM enzyme